MTVKSKLWQNILITCGLLALSSLASAIIFWVDSATSANVELIYVLALVLIARFTSGYLYGVFASVVAVVCVNFFYTYPYLELNFTLSGYPMTFLGMLSITLVTSAAASNIKEQARIITEREKLLAAAEKEKMRATLLRAVSHDLRTPLTGIIGAGSSYLENDKALSGEEKTALVFNICEDAQWLLNMVENLLAVTRINSQGASVTTSLEPVEEVVSEAVQRFRKRLPGVRIRVKVPSALLMIPMDAVLIEQVIINLLENAATHAKSEQDIDFYIEDSPAYVVFHVRDYGVGISQEKLSSLFDGADALSEQSDGHRGMGIGLSICRTIITAHGGTIDALNHIDGAEFLFTLPKERQEN